MILKERSNIYVPNRSVAKRGFIDAAGQVAGAFVIELWGHQAGSLIAGTGVLDNVIDWLAGCDRRHFRQGGRDETLSFPPPRKL